jgi:aspartate 1-decarboxylase
MELKMMKSKIHRATVTQSELNYEGSITLCRDLCRLAGIHEFEQVDVLNITNGERFTTYALYGSPGQVCVNGAAARRVQKGDLVIIVCYASIEQKEALSHQARVVLVNGENQVKEIADHKVRAP